MVFVLGQSLVAKPTPFARFSTADLANLGAFRWGTTLSLTPQGRRYTGTLVLLIDEVSQSSAEYTAMAPRAAPGALVIGSTTAAGQASDMVQPGLRFEAEGRLRTAVLVLFRLDLIASN